MIRKPTEKGKVKARRDIIILERLLDDDPLDEIVAQAGLSKVHTLQCAYRLAGIMRQRGYLDEPFPNNTTWFRMKDLQKHKTFWLRRIAKLRMQWELDEPITQEET